MRKIKEKSVLTQRDGVEKVIFGIFFAIVCIQVITIIVPLFFMITNSFKSSMDFLRSKLWEFPNKWMFQNWKDAFLSLTSGGTGTKKASFIVMIWNSLWLL